MAKITEIKANIFESSCQTLVNTVNCVGVMGRGLALEFKNRFPAMFKSYEEICNKQLLEPGMLYLYKDCTPWILNFPTKVHWKHPSQISHIEFGLKKFSETYAAKGITSIAFPQLGTSLGGLQWDDVKKLMYQYLRPLKNIDIEIYHFDPTAKDSLFDKLLQRINRFDVVEYKKYLGINRKQALLIIEAIREGRLHSMMSLQNIKGVGDKTLEMIYRFAADENMQQRIVTEQEKQPALF